MTISDIKDIIASGRVDLALDAIKKIAANKGDSRTENDIILQSGRYHQNENQFRRGTVDEHSYNRTTAQIRNALLEYLDDFSDADAAFLPSVKPEPGNNGGGGQSNPDTPTPIKKETVILFLSSNPSNTAKLQLESEHASISNKIQESPNYNKFKIKLKRAVTLSEFQEFIFLEKPNIVHFSGHGDRNNAELTEVISRGLHIESGQNTAPKDDTGIILNDESKRDPFFVGTNVIQRIFRTMVQRQQVPIEAVVFNSCYSEAQAKALAGVVPYVIGTSWSVKDDAAVAFARGFYFGIAQGEGIEDAFDLGINQALAYGEPEDRFVLYKNGEKVALWGAIIHFLGQQPKIFGAACA